MCDILLLNHAGPLPGLAQHSELKCVISLWGPRQLEVTVFLVQLPIPLMDKMYSGNPEIGGFWELELRSTHQD